MSKEKIKEKKLYPRQVLYVPQLTKGFKSRACKGLCEWVCQLLLHWHVANIDFA